MLAPRERPGRRIAPGAALLALALAGPAPAAPPAGPDLHATYRLVAQVRVDASPFPAREEEVHADAILSPGARRGEVRIQLAAQGGTCELTASLDAAGALALPAGQRCSADLRGEETVGRVDARLLSGSGRLRDEALELELVFALSGSVQFRSGSTLGALGKALSLPGSDDQPVPVHGEARGRAEGRRDRSRAVR